MKTEKVEILALLISGLVQNGFSQGFVNLDFESANVPDVEFGTPVAITDGLPDWNGYIGGTQQTQVWHNSVSAGSPAIVILGPTFPFGVIGGNYSVLLTGSYQSATISQDGTVSLSAQSLLFDAIPGTGGFGVTFAGNSLPVELLQTTPNYNIYGADISSFAGETGELAFTAFSTSSGLNNFYLDNISFTSSPVPEPSVFALTALGGLLLGFLRRR